MLEKLYSNYLLKYPKLFLTLIVFCMAMMAINTTKLEIDASAQTLLLEGDKDLEFMRKVGKNFTANDFLLITYTVEDNLLSDVNLENINQISENLAELPNIQSITSILNVPLLQSPPRPIKELVGDVKTLQNSEVDKNLVKKEFLTSAIYKQNLVSDDFKTTAIAINLKRDEKYATLVSNETQYIKLKQTKQLDEKELANYKKAQLELKEYRDILRVENHNLIVNVREILTKYETTTNAELHLGGASMVADDMVEFVKNDLELFGIVIVLLLIGILYILFKEIRWVFLPLFISTVSIVITGGLFGAIGWEITVVSSNFISLQLIMNMSLVVHLIIKYKELLTLHPTATQKLLVTNTALSMVKPSFFVVITTIAGFSSLVFSNILPIIHFGWMMSIGIVISLIITFLLFPIVLSFMNKSKEDRFAKTDVPFTSYIANIAFNYKKTILFITVIVILFSITGAMKLRVENSFIDYFKKETQIYQGMKLIDQKLGGTTPLDVVLTFKENSDEVESVEVKEDTLLDSFEDEFALTKDDKEKYWFTASKLEKIKKIHSYLDSLEPIGKVLSLATLVEVGKSLNDGKELDGVTLALLNKELPAKYKQVILSPYVSIQNNMARISTRVIDSQEGLQREQLIQKINKDISQIINPKTEEFRISNLLVMYNNMLQSLFDSQINTIGLTVLILFIMFLILFKNIKIAMVAIIANIIPVGVIFGFMGWMDIPLDMMTITIAAISIGIAVDDTIHYIHRYKLELQQTGSLKQAVINGHKSIGRAMFYTSTIIMIGFSILVLSNFVPTIYFGLLTMIAMFMAIVADLLLLPVLLLLIKETK
jgi:hypothetical protein